MRRPRAAAPAPRVPPSVARALLDWFRSHRRALPWRADRDPYRIWVAEVLLQQTRVEQAIPYFGRFVTRFPTVGALAEASESDVLKSWQGAGYYARARRLHEAARYIARERGERFPSTVAEWEELPGVGPYTARALASQLKGVPVVALEANGLRVAARWTLEIGEISAAVTRRRIAGVLEALLPVESPGEFNEALMELGETICRPAAPSCPECPVRFGCRAARELSDPSVIPVRPPARRRPHVRGAVVVLERADRWLVQRRPNVGLLGGMWEFPGGKIEAGETPRDAAARELWEETGTRARRLTGAGVVRHRYSHFSVELHVFRGRLLRGRSPGSRPGRRWVTRAAFARLPVGKATEKIVDMLRAMDAASPGPGSRPGRTLSGGPGAGVPRSVRPPARGTTSSGVRRRARR